MGGQLRQQSAHGCQPVDCSDPRGRQQLGDHQRKHAHLWMARSLALLCQRKLPTMKVPKAPKSSAQPCCADSTEGPAMAHLTFSVMPKRRQYFVWG